MDENRVKKRAREYLKEYKKCKIMPKEVVWTPNGLQQQKLDIVGVSPRGKTYVVECKAGVIGRPLQGVGQLTRYRVLIEGDFSGFQRKLGELAEDNELKKRITKISESKLRYYLAVPKNRSKEWSEILQECCRYLGFKEKKYRDILVFKYEGYK